ELPPHDREWRPCVAAARTAIVAEVAHVRRGIRIRRPAANAVLGVRSVLQRRTGMPRIVEPEDCRARVCAREIAHLRIVAVDHERGLRIELRNGAAPPLGHELELAVAVELVTEEVAETDGARPDAARNLR